MKKNIIIFVNAIRPATFAALEAYTRKTGRKFEPIVLIDKKIESSITERNSQTNLRVNIKRVVADFDSPLSLHRALYPYRERIFAITCQYENSILELQKLIPNVPYLPMPLIDSLTWATEKKLMRQKLESYDKLLVPGYMEVHDSSSATINRIERQLTYPLIIKPSGLEGSLLVSMVHDSQEMREVLAHTFQEIQKAYDVWIKRQVPAVLVEEFMEGDMYSVDVYVAPDGTCRPTPPVKVVTGKKVGFDDFFGYVRLLPSGLSTEEIQEAYDTSEQACRALSLVAVTAHVELMKTPLGWKVIELGPRIGGYRHDMYSLGYGINHIVNDIRNRAGEEPDIPEEIKGHVAVFNMYAHEEGLLESVEGLDVVKNLSSFVSLKQLIHEGEELLFARNNGDPVFEITLCHENDKRLRADIRDLEAYVQIHAIPFAGHKNAHYSSIDKTA